MSDEADAILRAARAQRTRPSRTLWIVTLVVGGICAVAFGIVLLADGTASTTPRTQSTGVELGFPIGLLVGGVIGIGIGFAIARQRQSTNSHSERNSP